MKNKLVILFLSVLVAVVSGCAKLDQEPKSSATANTIFNSQNGLELYANSFYDILPFASDFAQSDAMSDYMARSGVPDFIRANAFTPTQSSGWSWSQLRNINYYIDNLHNVSRLDASIKNNYLGLARFFRAWFYFDKLKRFGDVPWISLPIPLDDPALMNERDPRTLVVDSIIADLDFAAENITANTENTRTLITKTVVLGFKSRVCLFEGTFRKYHDEYNLQSSANGLLQQAADAANKVIQSGAYSLYNGGGLDQSYRQLFSSTSVVTQEVMLSSVVDATLGVYHDANWRLTSATYGSRLSFIRTFINTYLNIDGTRFTDNPAYKTMTFPQEVKNRDKRLQQTIRMGDYKRINAGKQEPAPPIFSYTYTGYQPIKYTLDDMYYDGGTRNINPIAIMRYAEILLNYAEAKAELGTLTDADWNITIGALRRRAGITANTATKPATVDTYLKENYFPEISDPVILEVRRERAIELAMEGFRFEDLVRWKKGDLLEMQWNGFYVPALNTPMDLNEDGIMDVAFYQTEPATKVKGVTYINVAPTVSGQANPQRLSNNTYGEIKWLDNIPRTFEQKNYLYPIPESDRLVNPKLGQNPGWGN